MSTPTLYVRPCVSVPASLERAHRRIRQLHTTRSPSQILADGMRADLLAAGEVPPDEPTPGRTAAATAAARRKRLQDKTT